MNKPLFPIILAGLIGMALLHGTADADEQPVFSGPQKGEKLPPLPVKGVYGDAAGKTFDYAKLADGKPTVLIFLHERTRPAARVIRAVMGFSGKKKPGEAFSGIVLLTDDATKTEQWLTIPSVRKALAADQKTVHVGISPDGREGPGAYGLNRNVTLTILVANEGRVTANFALVQPSVQADVLKVVKQFVQLTGDDVPELRDLFQRRYRGKKSRNKQGGRRQLDPQLAGLLRAVIQKDLKAEEVDKAAARVEKHVGKHPEARPHVARIARVIVKRNYGTARAQEVAKQWVKQYASTPQKTENE